MKQVMKDRLLPIVTEIGRLLLIAWLFYDFSVASFLLLLYPIPAWVKRKAEQKKRERWELNLAFKDALTCLESNLSVGYSPESSLKESLKNLEVLYGKEHAICNGFRQMLQQMELGSSMEEVFLEYGRESGVEDIRQLAEIFALVKRTGGNLTRVLRQTAGILQEKIELKRELHGAVASKKLEFQIMCVVPCGILLYLRLFAPSMCAGLYHSVFGTVFMSMVLLVYVILCCLGDRIIHTGIGKWEGDVG